MRSIREDLWKTTWTEQNGYATQFLAYMPFGETLSEQQNSTSYYSPFTFSAKEKDPETGYSYFGARYYSPELSVWLGVDPLADKAPGWTPYRYGFNNPIGFVDPDGMFESKAKAKEYAENNGIRTGWFSRNKVVSNGDGTWSIENRRNHSSITDLGPGLGVKTCGLVVGERNSTSAQSNGGWDVEKAVNYLNSHAYDPNGPYKYGRGQCSPYTPRAINAGFGDNRIPTNLAGSAYGPSLLKVGFTLVKVTNLNSYIPLKGDIAVMNGPPGSKTCNTGIGGPCGHIQMYNGNKWVSDFFQTRPFWPGPAYQNATPQLRFQIFRWSIPSS